MSSSKTKKEVPVRAELSARAEANLEVQATVPEHSAGRFLDAVTDIFRPFSEARGLRADRIRLQREDVAIEVARKARERLAIENTEIRPVPNKVLIPLIEAASNEDIDDTFMLDMWANLLASAASGNGVEPRFVGILRELSGSQAGTFERLVRNNSEKCEKPFDVLKNVSANLNSSLIHETLKELYLESDDPPKYEEIIRKFPELFKCPGVFILELNVGYRGKARSFSSDDRKISFRKLHFDLDMLSSIGLCRKIQNNYGFIDKGFLTIVYYCITTLGAYFFFSCHGIKLDTEMP